MVPGGSGSPFLLDLKDLMSELKRKMMRRQERQQSMVVNSMFVMIGFKLFLEFEGEER